MGVYQHHSSRILNTDPHHPLILPIIYSLGPQAPRLLVEKLPDGKRQDAKKKAE